MTSDDDKIPSARADIQNILHENFLGILLIRISKAYPFVASQNCASSMDRVLIKLHRASLSYLFQH